MVSILNNILLYLEYIHIYFFSYELQIEPAVMRRGLGKFMMQILELVAFTNHMRKVVLTVLKHNKYNYFFKALKYV